MNQVKTFFLMVVLTVILVGLGSVIGGKNGAVLAFAVALAMNFVSYWFSDRIVLAHVWGEGGHRGPGAGRLQYPRDFVSARIYPDAQGVRHRE